MSNMLFIGGMCAALAMLATYCERRRRNRDSANQARNTRRDCCTVTPHFSVLQAIFLSDPLARVEPMSFTMMELHCSRELALKLGALDAASPQHHRELRASGACIMVRDPATLTPMFWPVVPADRITIIKSTK